MVFTIQREPDNFAILIKNTELNGYQNVILENKTVPDKTQKMRLYLTPTKGDHKIYDSRNSHKFIEVECIRSGQF